jgi:transposase
MDTSQQVTVIPGNRERSASSPKRQRRSIAEKRRIVEETLGPGASVARVARAHGVNANQVFYWRKLYQAGRLGASAAQLLPVRVQRESSAPAVTLTEPRCSAASFSGTIHLELRHAQVRIEGNADPALLRVLLECLRA